MVPETLQLYLASKKYVKYETRAVKIEITISKTTLPR